MDAGCRQGDYCFPRRERRTESFTFDGVDERSSFDEVVFFFVCRHTSEKTVQSFEKTAALKQWTIPRLLPRLTPPDAELKCKGCIAKSYSHYRTIDKSY